MLRFPDKPEASAVVGALGFEVYQLDFRGPLMRLSPGNMTAETTIDTVFDIVEQNINRRRRRYAGKGDQFQVSLHGREKSVDTSNILGTLDAMLLSGEVKVFDCTATLGPITPILGLRKGFGQNTPKVEIH